VDTAEAEVAMVAEAVAMVDDSSNNKLLLLEDDPLVAKSLIRYLELHSYSIDWAIHGEEALDLSYDNHYQLYLIDINVPLLNGIDLLQMLRESGNRTPAIIISAQVDVESVTRGFIAGADDYLKKPFDPQELLIRIQAKTKALDTKKIIGTLEINFAKEEIYLDNNLLYIPEIQRKILISLAINYPNPATKDELLLLLESPTDIALRVNITKLKKRLDIQIKNIRGVGYQII